MAKPTYDPSPSYELVPNIARADGATQDSRPRMRGIRWWSKLIPFYVIIPVAVSLTIEILHMRPYKSTGSLYRWSTSDRTSVQVVVHILSTILAILLVYPTCTVLSFWTRHCLSQRDVELKRLRLWSAMVQGRLDWSLPWLLSLMTLAFFALTYLPATLWAGALTPVLTTKVEHNIALHVPTGGPDGDYAPLSPPNPPPGIFGECWTKLQSNGTFTNCPLKYNTGNLLQTIATATNPDPAPRNHSKWDNTAYQYVGRSYGVGAATGLTDDSLNATSGYNYTQTGLLTKTTCIYNESATWKIYKTDDLGNDTAPYQWFYASGQLPNSDWYLNTSNPYGNGSDFFYQLDFTSGNEIVASLARPPIARDLDSGNGQYFFGLAARSTYKQLDKIQCEMTFEPTMFLVVVSTTNRTMTVTPDTDAGTDNPDAKGNLRTRALEAMKVSYVVLSLYTSFLGNAFMANVHNMQNQLYPMLVDAPSIDNATVLAAVGDSVTALVDDLFVALTAAVLTQESGAQLTHANATIPAVQIGSSGFIAATLAMNVLGVIGVFVALFLLRNADIPLFDYNDLGCMFVGVWNGAKLSTDSRGEIDGHVLHSWDGGATSKEMNALTAKLQVTESGQPAMITTRTKEQAG